MKRAIPILLISIILLGVAGRAAHLPDWAVPLTKETTGEWDPNETDSVVLLDSCQLTVNAKMEAVQVIRKAIRILSEKGSSEGVETIHLSPGDKVSDLKGSILYPNGEVKTVDSSDAVETQLLESGLFSESRKRIISLPNPGKGCIVCFEYQLKHKLELPYFEWYSGGRSPVVRSELTLVLMDGVSAEFKVSPEDCMKPVGSGSNMVFSMGNIPAIPVDPLSPPLSDSASHLLLRFRAPGIPTEESTAKGWEAVARWYQGLTKSLWTPTESVSKQAASICDGASSDEEKIRRLCSWVQSNIRYVAIEIGIGGWVPHSPASVLSNRYGDCKDKAFLLMTMLRSQGIQSWPVLCRPKSFGAIRPDFPTHLFNHVILSIRTPAGETCFDPTSSTVGFPYLPLGLQNTWGLVVREETGELKALKGKPGLNVRIQQDVVLAEDGFLTAHVTERYSPDAADDIRTVLQPLSGSDREKWMFEQLSRHLPGLKMVGVTLSGIFELTDDLVLDYRISAPDVLRKAGGMMTFWPFFVEDFDKPVLAKATRRTDLDFSDQACTLYSEINIHPPVGFRMEEGLETTECQCAGGTYSLKSSTQTDLIRVVKELKIEDKVLPKSRYSEVQSFFNAIRNAEESRILFIRK